MHQVTELMKEEIEKPPCNIFVELGGGVDDMPRWCRDGVCVELGFR